MRLSFKISSITPYLSAIVIFLIVSFAYFPEVLDGKKLTGHDNATFAGMSKEIVDFREETGKEPLWTNRMFGGMPAYLVSTRFTGNVLAKLNTIMQLGPRPVSFLFLYMIGFFILLLSFRVNPWLAIAGAIAFCFSSFNFVIIAAGHNSQAIAIGYVAPMLAGIIISFRGKPILGAALTGLFLSLEILAGHPQITYYSMLLVFIFGLAQLYFAIREKYVKELTISVAILFVALFFGVTSNAGRLWTTMEYGKYSMRTPSELSGMEDDKTSGLTKSYATQWSYGIDETLTLLIPNFKGGSVDGALRENSETYRLFAQNNPAQAKEIIKHLPLYWGTQPGTIGPYYVGAIIVFLFILGMFIVDRRLKWWLFTATILSIMLSWGKNFMFLTEFFMDHVPGYNKFRTVTMALSITQLTMPLMAILALKKLLFEEVPKKQFNNALKWSFGIAGGISLVFALFPDLAGDFIANRDAQYQDVVAKAFQADRRSILQADAFRSFIFIALSAGLILLYKMKKVNVNLAIAIIGILIISDMWPVTKRYLNKDHFTNKREATQTFKETAADQFILKDPELNYRVLNLSQSVFQESNTSYYHNSIGGYHGAKMRRYQDLIDNRFDRELNRLITGLQSQNMDSISYSLRNVNALNMLNTRYIIINPQGQPLLNPFAKGNAWLVNDYKIVQNADEEMAFLGVIDIDNTATVDLRFSEFVEGKTFRTDSTAQINLIDYQPNKLTYAYKAASEQLVVFSEIYYEKGWTANIDGDASDHFRVNYALRGMVVPEGDHEIVFEFHPKSYYLGNKISLASSVILLLLLLGAAFYQWKNNDKFKGKDILTN